MKLQKLIFLVLSVVLLSGHATPQKSVNARKTTDTEATKQKSASRFSTEETETKCVRGQAEPIVKKNAFPGSTFVLQPDKLTAYETVILNKQEKLIIHNYGCEYYILTFRFETNRFQADPADIPFWYRKCIILMHEIQNRIDAPLDIDKGLESLSKYINKDVKNGYKNLRPGEMINYGGDDIRSYVTVDRIEKLKENKYAVEISFGSGPL